MSALSLIKFDFASLRINENLHESLQHLYALILECCRYKRFSARA